MKVTKTATADGPITLDDLRAMVATAKDADGTVRVNVKEGKIVNSFDNTRDQIRVTWEVEA